MNQEQGAETQTDNSSPSILPDGYFFDGVEPSSGLPYFTTSTSSVYSEVEGLGSMLKYNRSQAGQCCLLEHPRYGFSCYPNTLVVAGVPLDELYQIMLSISEPIDE
jgi:hypothetical protein